MALVGALFLTLVDSHASECYCYTNLNDVTKYCVSSPHIIHSNRIVAMTCEYGSYRRLAPVCQNTCIEPDASKKCDLPPSETCVCPPGQVLNNDECIPASECGCVDKKFISRKVWL